MPAFCYAVWFRCLHLSPCLLAAKNETSQALILTSPDHCTVLNWVCVCSEKFRVGKRVCSWEVADVVMPL